MSDDEFLRFCAANEPLHFEREPNGEILVMSPGGFSTSVMNSSITTVLRQWAESDGRGVATGPDGGYTLPDGSVRAPDAAWVSLEKVNALSEEQKARFAPLSPDFVIELRSPSDKLSDLQAKMEQWIANGVQVGWLIDPTEKSVTIYGPGADPEHLANPVAIQGAGPIAGFELTLTRIWEK
jgi:Uma2 family endonuclease